MNRADLIIKIEKLLDTFSTVQEMLDELELETPYERFWESFFTGDSGPCTEIKVISDRELRVLDDIGYNFDNQENIPYFIFTGEDFDGLIKSYFQNIAGAEKETTVRFDLLLHNSSLFTLDYWGTNYKTDEQYIKMRAYFQRLLDKLDNLE